MKNLWMWCGGATFALTAGCTEATGASPMESAELPADAEAISVVEGATSGELDALSADVEALRIEGALARAALQAELASLRAENEALRVALEGGEASSAAGQPEVRRLSSVAGGAHLTSGTVFSSGSGCTLSYSGDEVTFDGCNVYVQSGTGSTNGSVNGLGNLIVGYDEDDGGDSKTGSHNLVVGRYHSYTSYGGLLGGYDNAVSGAYASASGGAGNDGGDEGAWW